MHDVGFAPHTPITLVVIDDHEMLVTSLIRLLEGQPDIVVLGSAGTVAAGLEVVRELQPDVALVDYNLPDGDGASTALEIGRQWPNIRVILLTGSGSQVASYEAARSGCAGYLEKTAPAEQLTAMVRSVHAGARELEDPRLSRLPLLSELTVYFQPIVDLGAGDIIGFEALVRWLHPTRGMVLPDAFIPLAEQTELILEIGEYVRREACQWMADWNRRFPRQPPRFMSVNLSGRELARPDLARQVDRVLDLTGLDPPDLMIEMTETHLINSGEVSQRLASLKDIGVRLALDDFGTGYSSLGYLRRFPIDAIKLDKSFTDELPHGDRALRLFGAVRRLASDMGAVAEAEGIESKQQIETLLSLGWSMGQGYWYSKPVPASEIEAMLRAEPV